MRYCDARRSMLKSAVKCESPTEPVRDIVMAPMELSQLTGIRIHIWRKELYCRECFSLKKNWIIKMGVNLIESQEMEIEAAAYNNIWVILRWELKLLTHTKQIKLAWKDLTKAILFTLSPCVGSWFIVNVRYHYKLSQLAKAICLQCDEHHTKVVSNLQSKYGQSITFQQKLVLCRNPITKP